MVCSPEILLIADDFLYLKFRKWEFIADLKIMYNFILLRSRIKIQKKPDVHYHPALRKVAFF
ncbi:hypothetical protein B6D60_01075 [candidate division KSB1 bacterium 4484_87]|nr:MAG: hypothetical protein B6D60_01075 [candidate division KSB1 bacterium 4484_87]